MEKSTVTNASYYNTLYQQMIDDAGDPRWAVLRERDRIVAQYLQGTVFDIGCGLGTISAYIEGYQYVGVDYSKTAITWARRYVGKTKAVFVHADAEVMVSTLGYNSFETVLMSEFLEHVETPKWYCQQALAIASKRVVVTVPRTVVTERHVKSMWNLRDIREILGRIDENRLFGGGEGSRWWLAVRRVEDE